MQDRTEVPIALIVMLATACMFFGFVVARDARPDTADTTAKEEKSAELASPEDIKDEVPVRGDDGVTRIPEEEIDRVFARGVEDDVPVREEPSDVDRRIDEAEAQIHREDSYRKIGASDPEACVQLSDEGRERYDEAGARIVESDPEPADGDYLEAVEDEMRAYSTLAADPCKSQEVQDRYRSQALQSDAFLRGVEYADSR